MNLDDTATQLLYTTVPIWATDPNGNTISGTGFIFTYQKDDEMNIPVVVTNKHVVEGASSGLIAVVRGANSQPSKNERITIELDGDLLKSKIHPKLDIAIFPFGPIVNELNSRGTAIFYKSITKDILPSPKVASELSAIEDVTFIGYPSGLYDRKNNTPVIRRGITASPFWNDFEGEPIFLIDAGVYPGSSGSPVFIYNRGSYPTPTGIGIGNRVIFLGVLAESIIRTEPDAARTYIGLGRVIKGDQVMAFIEEFAMSV